MSRNADLFSRHRDSTRGGGAAYALSGRRCGPHGSRYDEGKTRTRPHFSAIWSRQISADTQLLLPDYRAGERTFQLLTQVAGRAGRKDKQGQVIIQTFSPDEPSILFAKIHDYENFFRHEVSDRGKLGYPPFSRMIRLLFKGGNEINVQRTAERFMRFLGDRKDFRILGPAPAPLAKIQGNFRYHILFMSIKKQDAGARHMKSQVSTALNEFRRAHQIRKVSITVDVDPNSIL
jgi:primosomal protein N' (replication factor Y)